MDPHSKDRRHALNYFDLKTMNPRASAESKLGWSFPKLKIDADQGTICTRVVVPYDFIKWTDTNLFLFTFVLFKNNFSKKL